MNRQTIIVHHSLTGAIQSFSKNLFLDFTPSTVIIRGVDYGEGAGATDLHGIIAPWSDNPIATFIDDTNNGYTSNPGTTFKINNPGVFSNGQITFQVRRLNNATSASTATGKISLTLEFIMEKQVSPKINVDMKPLMDLISARIPVNAFSRELSFGMGMTGDTVGGMDRKETECPICFQPVNYYDSVNLNSGIPNARPLMAHRSCVERTANTAPNPDNPNVRITRINTEGDIKRALEGPRVLRQVGPQTRALRAERNRREQARNQRNQQRQNEINTISEEIKQLQNRSNEITNQIAPTEIKMNEIQQNAAFINNIKEKRKAMIPFYRLKTSMQDEIKQREQINARIIQLQEQIRTIQGQMEGGGQEQGQEEEQDELIVMDTRNTEDQVNPIPNVHSTLENEIITPDDRVKGEEIKQEGGVREPLVCQRARELSRKKHKLLHRRKRGSSGRANIMDLSIKEKEELSRTKKECNELKRKLKIPIRKALF